MNSQNQSQAQIKHQNVPQQTSHTVFFNDRTNQQKQFLEH